MDVDLEMVAQEVAWTQFKEVCLKMPRGPEVNQEIQSK